MISANAVSMFGVGLLALGLVIIFLTPYRRWLWFMLAGMIFWSGIECLRLLAQSTMQLGLVQSYVVALSVALVAMALYVFKQDAEAKPRTKAKIRVKSQRSRAIEHTPVYPPEQRHYSRGS